MIFGRRPVLVGVVLLMGCSHRGATAPSFSAFAGVLPTETASGAPFLASGLEGRVVLVTFIATWCMPCLAELATLKKLEESLGPQGFSNVLVGMDLEGRLVLEPFVMEYTLECPLVVADDRLRSGATPFGQVRELPSRVLFGRDGAAVAASSGVSRYQELERLVMAELARR